MYYWQSDTPQFIPEGDWNEEREKYGSYDGKIKPNVESKVIATRSTRRNQESLDIELGYGLRKEVIKRRLKAGWKLEEALSKPLQPKRKHKSRFIFVGCQKFNFVEFARYIGVTYSQLNYKFRRDKITKTHWQEWEIAQLIEQWYSKEVSSNGN